MRSTLLALVVALAPATSSAGPCAIRPFAAHSLTANNTELPEGGGVVMALGDLQGIQGAIQPDLTKTSWKFSDGKRTTAPVIRPLAPGLAVFEPPAGTSTVTLVDGKRTLLTLPRAKAGKPTLAAPVVTGVAYVTSSLPPGPRQSPRDALTAQLASARPEGAIALVVFAAGTPATWISAFAHTGTQGEVELWHTAGRCELVIPGMTAPRAGAKVTLAWVDATGRLGARSKELVVASKSLP